jgi:regulator of protease activity HflC (stomatin/prohibitin superfamily)
MGRYADDRGNVKVGSVVVDVSIVTVLFGILLMAGCPQYNVWQQGLAGQAELKRAEANRKIAVQEAEAKKESAHLLAEAEIIRAGGVAQANKIIGDSLKGNEAYLRYLWVETLSKDQKQIIYIPTEAGMPILEAGKRP